MKKILILSANPINTNRLRLDEEVSEIQRALKRAQNREAFQVISIGAARIDDLREMLLDNNPQIVHFSGHGTGTNGLVLENTKGEGEPKIVSTESLSDLFELFKEQVECVLLNACYSEIQAKAIHEHIDCVIGMTQPIQDDAAINFSKGFYDAIFSGRNYTDAFRFGCNNIDLNNIPSSNTPTIKIRHKDSPPPPTVIEQAARLKDVEPLKYQASLAQSRGELSLARQLWMRVLAASRDDWDAVNAIEKIAALRQSPPPDGEPQNFPLREILERRFEAAMPKQSKIGQKTEVRVMVVLPASPGLRADLPDITEAGDLITKTDVMQNQFSIEFPVDPNTHKLLPTTIFISLKAPDFDIEESLKSVFLPPKQDSGVATFFLTPRIPQKLARVIVELYTSKEHSILLSSLTLFTQIKSQTDVIGQVVWQLLTLPLSLVSAPIEKRFNLLLSSSQAESMKSKDILPPVAAKSKAPSDQEVSFLLAFQTFNFEVVTVNTSAQEFKRKRGQNQYFLEDLGNTVVLEMVLIPGGSFIMGSPEDKIGHHESENPQNMVTIKPFSLSKYPVTQTQWKAVAALPEVNRELKSNPSHFKGDNRPVEQVSWYDVIEFCDRLSQYTGRPYRLPSEAEWEYAACAGTTTPFHFGETITSELANYDASSVYGAGVKGIYRQETTPVGSFGVANAFGLYDMHGQVWEWCVDDWHDNYEGAPTDGSAWLDDNDNQLRLLRGGSWYSNPVNCRSASRSHDFPGYGRNYIGFRVVCGGAAENIL